MTTPIIDRKTFLGATVAACADFALGGCGGKSVLIESDDTGGTESGGTETGGTAAGGTTGGTETGGTGRGGTATGGTTGGTSRGGATTGGTATGGTGRGGVATGGTTGGTATGGVATGGTTGGTATGGVATGGTTGGTATGGGSSSYACKTVTDNGNHAHPLTIPWSDVERGYQDAPYVLEDGGTGHTHTLELAVYEFAYLSGGSMVTTTSSIAQGHAHSCEIACGPG